MKLDRFLDAQKYDYEIALSEIKAGRKQSHWIWYIFPQIKGLGRSFTAKHYSIQSKEEAREYIENDVLRSRLLEISEALLSLNENNPTLVMGGFPDDIKLQSSMTLFSEIAPEYPVFQKVLDKYFGGKKDKATLDILVNL